MASLSQYIQDNYPSPSEGDEFLWGGVRYTYDSTPGIWTGSIPDPDAVQDVATGTEPEDPIEGELWFDPSTKRLNVYDGEEFVDTNPQPTAEDLGIVPAVAVENDSTVVDEEATVLNFTDGLTATMTGTGEVSIAADLPEAPDGMVGMIENYTLEIATDGTATWSAIGDAASSIALDDLDGVSAPNDTAADELLASNGSGFEMKSLSELGIATAQSVTDAMSDVTQNTSDIEDAQDDILDLQDDVGTLQTDVTDINTMVDALALDDLSDVDVSSPSDGQYLSYNGTNWTPATAPVSMGGQVITIEDSGRTIDIDGTDNLIPVITSASLSNDTLTLVTNGSNADLTVDLSSLSGGGGSFDLTVNGDSNIDTLTFSDDFTVSSSSGTSTISIDASLSDIASNKTDIADLDTRVTSLEDDPIPADITIRKDGATIDNNASIVDFTGAGVTTTANGGGRVTVNIPGGSGSGSGSSPAIQQTAFDKSSERADKTQFHLNGGTNGGKFRVMIKNNNASSSRNIKYNFALSDSTEPSDNIAAGVTFADRPGLWDSDDERFIFYPSGSNGQINWETDTFTGLPARNVIQLEVDVKPNGRISFFTSNGNDVIWSYSSIGGFAEDFEEDTGGGDTPDPDPVDPGPNYANGDAEEGYAGPYFINRPISHYNMIWRFGSAQDMNKDMIMGGDGSSSQTSPSGNDFYKISDTSENIGIWVVSYYTTDGSANDNSSIGWGCILPGSSGDTTAQGFLDDINEYSLADSFESAAFSFNTSSVQYADPDLAGLGPDGFKDAPIDQYGPDLGAIGDAQAWTSWTGARPWHSVQSVNFYLPGSGGKAVELRRGQLRATRQSPANIAARLYAYEMLFRVYDT